MTTDGRQDVLEETRAQAHARCAICGYVNGRSPRLHFAASDDGSVQASFLPDEACDGYAGILHGGVIAALLDAAMTNCLFAQGRRALTAELCVRYRHPVSSSAPLSLRAYVEREARPLFVLHAEIRQADQVRATAVGKFMEKADTAVRRTENAASRA